MKKYLIYTLILIVVSSVFCSCNSSATYSSEREEGTSIDPDRNDQVLLSDLFSEIDIIPLETSDRSLLTFPMGEPDKVIKHEDKFYFLDKSQDVIVVFDDNGKFVNRLNKKGQGPGEYISLSDFNINRFSNNLEVLSPEGRCVIVYDLDSYDVIEKIQLPPDIPVVHQFHHLTPTVYSFASYASDFKLIFYSNDDSKIVESDYLLPQWFNHGTTFTPTSRNPFYLYNDSLHFVQIYNGDVFTLSPANYSLSSRYSWDFGEHNFTLSMLPENESIDYYLDRLKELGVDHAVLFQVYQENSRYYFTRFKFNNRYKHLVYDKRTNEYKLFEQFKEGGQCLPQWIDEEAIYTVIPPDFLHLVLSPSSLDEKNRQVYSQVEEEDNPVIIKYTLR